jgi:hypothetical protein
LFRQCRRGGSIGPPFPVSCSAAIKRGYDNAPPLLTSSAVLLEMREGNDSLKAEIRRGLRTVDNRLLYLYEPNRRVSRIRLSEKVSRGRPRKAGGPLTTSLFSFADRPFGTRSDRIYLPNCPK